MQLSLNDNLFRSALASKLSYSQDCKKAKQLHGTQICNIIDNRKTGAHTYIYPSGTNSKLIAFRGSHSFDQIANYCNPGMSSFHIRGHKVKVHSHILHLFQSIENDLTNIICTETTPQTYTFCGHSAGGAIAHFAAAYYGDIACRNQIICHTFGSPKMGNPAFIEWHNECVKESTDVIHKNDIVNYIPFGHCYAPFQNQIVLPCPKVNPLIAHDMETYLENIEIALQTHRFSN